MAVKRPRGTIKPAVVLIREIVLEASFPGGRTFVISNAL